MPVAADLAVVFRREWKSSCRILSSFFFIAYRVFYYNKSLYRDTDCVAYRPRRHNIAVRDFQRT